MSNKKDNLYSARWAISKAIDTDDYGKILDAAVDYIARAKADNITQDDEPDRPQPDDKDIDIKEKFIMPKIVVVPGVRFKTRGPFNTPSRKPDSLIVHYTVSGKAEKNAKGVVAYLAKKGLGCPVMDKDGVIYIPEGYDMFKDVVYHAGKSSIEGRSGLSRYALGIEICCYGKLNSSTKPRAEKIRVSGTNANIKSGEYEEYTPEQEQSLYNLIGLMKLRCPDFSVKKVWGHDEISPSRKSDPGASLSMTMPEYRKFLLNEKGD